MIPEYQTFLNDSNMGEFWNYIKWLLFLVAPIIMISFAIYAVQEFIGVMVRAFKRTEKKADKEDDDYEIYR